MSGVYQSVKREVEDDPIRGLSRHRTVSSSNPPVISPVGDFGYPGQIKKAQTTVSFRTRAREGDVEVVPRSGAEFIYLLKESGEIKNPKYDIGHEFYTRKVEKTCRFGIANLFGIDWEADYAIYRKPPGSPYFTEIRNIINTRNRFRSNGVWRYFEDDPEPSWFITTDDVASGKTAMNAAVPTRPVAGSATFIGELFAGLPTVIGATLLRDRIGLLRSLGSEYLNVQFGWLPLISDIQKTIKALSNATAILTNYADNSGRNVRRRYSLPDLTYSEFFSSGLGTVSAGDASSWVKYDFEGKATASGGGGQSPTVDQSTLVGSVTAKQERWFSGAFTYYVPAGGSFLKDIQRFEALSNKLLGTRLTPEVLWNLTPWTWLVDWILRLSDHISLYTRFSEDDLLLRYGYLMVRDQVKVSSNFGTHYSTRRPNGTIVTGNGVHFTLVKLDQKRRVRATPFGFGLDPNSFTARQWSILAALGMTKGPRSLR